MQETVKITTSKGYHFGIFYKTNMINNLDYTSTVTESLLEPQLKLKILYYCKEISTANLQNIKKTKPTLIRLSLKIIFSLGLKKVLSGKKTNRIMNNFFKLWNYSRPVNYNSKLEQNKSVLDINYNTTIKINSLYEFYKHII